MSGVDTGMINRAQEVMTRFSNLTPAPNKFTMATADDVAANKNVAFPVQLGSTDPDDASYHLRQQLVVGAGGVIPGVGIATADQKFFDYANRKQQQEVLYDFYRFMFAQADLSKPESANWWFSKFPWMRDLRLKEIDKEADLQKTLARIQITGPESEDDFMLLFLIRNGTVIVPTVPINQMGTVAGAQTFQEGFFSKLVTGEYWNPPWNWGVGANIGGPLAANKFGIKWETPVPTAANALGPGFKEVGPWNVAPLLGGAPLGWKQILGNKNLA